MRHLRTGIICGLILVSGWSRGLARADAPPDAYIVCTVYVTTPISYAYDVQAFLVKNNDPEQCAGKGQPIVFNLSEPAAIYWKALLLTAKTLGRPVTYEKPQLGAVPISITLH